MSIKAIESAAPVGRLIRDPHTGPLGQSNPKIGAVSGSKTSSKPGTKASNLKRKVKRVKTSTQARNMHVKKSSAKARMTSAVASGSDSAPLEGSAVNE